MKVAVIGGHLHPDILEALHQLNGMGADITLKGVLSCHADLRTYLNLRGDSEVYAEVRGTERLGVPYFVCKDGTVTLGIQTVLGK